MIENDADQGPFSVNQFQLGHLSLYVMELCSLQGNRSEIPFPNSFLTFAAHITCAFCSCSKLPKLSRVWELCRHGHYCIDVSCCISN
jgi:hypothetical protein